MIPNGAVSQKLSLSHSKIRYATLSIANVRKKGFGNCPFIISQRQLTTAPQSKVLFVTKHFIFSTKCENATVSQRNFANVICQYQTSGDKI